MKKAINDIFNMHKFINDQVYIFLNPYKNPNQNFQIEEAITRHLLNAFMNATNKSQIKHFTRVSPEVMTGTDFLIIFRGMYQGKRSEFKVLYQAKLTCWDKDEPCIKIDLTDKILRKIPLPFSFRHLLNLSPEQLEKIKVINELIGKPYFPHAQFQHDAQINFGQLINAETLYICYRHRIDKNKKKKESVGFVNTKHLDKYFIQKKVEYIPEKLLGKKFYFYNRIDSFLRKYIKKILNSKEGFFFWMSNFENFYNGYLEWMDAQNKVLTSDEKDYKLNPVGLNEENSFLQLLPIQTEQELHQLGPLYQEGETLYLLNISKEESIGIDNELFSPHDILIIELDEKE